VGIARFRDTGEELYEPAVLESLMPDTTAFDVDCRVVTTLTGVVTPTSERVPEKKQVRVSQDSLRTSGGSPGVRARSGSGCFGVRQTQPPR